MRVKLKINLSVLYILKNCKDGNLYNHTLITYLDVAFVYDINWGQKTYSRARTAMTRKTLLFSAF